MNLYVTADQIGVETGGGLVTKNESEALRSLGPCEVWGRVSGTRPPPPPDHGMFNYSHPSQVEPWTWDNLVHYHLLTQYKDEWPRLAHFYAGTFSDAISFLQEKRCKVTYTAAAHDITASRREHEALGLPFDYPHLMQDDLWRRYVAGYLAADVLVCPSLHSANVMRGFGAKQRIEVIPHGVELPERVAPLPRRFTVGYMGACGPDKGVRYLLEAWKQLAYPDATLILAGRDSTSSWVTHLIERFGGGNIVRAGWVNRVSDFYDSISVYVQPSVTEGFGIEVLEAMAHGRPVICSLGAGADDVLQAGKVGQSVRSGSAEVLADAIKGLYSDADWCQKDGAKSAQVASKYTWDKIRQRYVALWKELLGE